MEGDEAYPDEDAQDHGTPEVDVRATLADGHVRIECGDGKEGPVDRKHAQERGTLQPLFAADDEQKLMGYQSQTKHRREGDERYEAQHLAENVAVVTDVVANAGEYGLCHPRDHTVDGVDALVVPIAGVRIDTCRGSTIEAA